MILKFENLSTIQATIYLTSVKYRQQNLKIHYLCKLKNLGNLALSLITYRQAADVIQKKLFLLDYSQHSFLYHSDIHCKKLIINIRIYIICTSIYFPFCNPMPIFNINLLECTKVEGTQFFSP